MPGVRHSAQIVVQTKYDKLDRMRYASLDPDVVKQARGRFNDLEASKRTTPENLLIFQLLGETIIPEEYASCKSRGYLFNTSLARCMFDGKLYDSMEIHKEARDTFIKTTLYIGYIFKNGEHYEIDNHMEGSVGHGFWFDVWNNNLPHITKQDVDELMGRVTGRIKQNYREFLEILYERHEY